MWSAHRPGADRPRFAPTRLLLAASLVVASLPVGTTTAKERIIINTPGGLPYAALSPSGKYIAGNGPGGERPVLVFDTTTGKLLATLNGHANVATRIHFSADEKTLTTFCSAAASDVDKTNVTWVKRWNLETKAEIESFALPNSGVNKAISSDGRFLATIRFRERTPLLWDLDRKTKFATIIVDSKQASSVAVHSSGKLAVVGGSGGDISIWELPSEKLLKKVNVAPTDKTDTHPYAKFLEISPDGKTLASLHDRFRCRLWNIKDGKQIGETFQAASTQCWFTPDGKFIAVGAKKNGIDFRSVETQKIVLTLESVTPDFRVGGGFCMSADGRTLAVGTHIWTVPELKP